MTLSCFREVVTRSGGPLPRDFISRNDPCTSLSGGDVMRSIRGASLAAVAGLAVCLLALLNRQSTGQIQAVPPRLPQQFLGIQNSRLGRR